MKKKSMLLVVLLITVGFAAVSTTLIMNGVINIANKPGDFNVYFSEAILDDADVSDTTISSDKKIISFNTKNLKNVGDTSVLEYEVTNNSTQYDASVEVNCTPTSGDYFILTNSLTETIIAGTRENGQITIELTKASISEQNINFTCTLNVTATERTNAVAPIIEAKITKEDCRATTGDGTNVGDKIACGEEVFYVTDYDGTHIKMLAEYNLLVGFQSINENNTWITSPIIEETGKQSLNAIGYKDSGYPFIGVVPYGKTTEYMGSDIENYVIDYKNYLQSNFNLQEIEASIITKEELISLGCYTEYNTCLYSEYPWIYQTSYWTKSSYSDNHLWAIGSSGSFREDFKSNNYYRGVRPLITILKDNLS